MLRKIPACELPQSRSALSHRCRFQHRPASTEAAWAHRKLFSTLLLSDKCIYQVQFLFSCQALDPRLLAERSRSINCGPCGSKCHRTPGTGVFCATRCAVVLVEASLYIGCDAGVERPIRASDDVDVVRHLSATLVSYCGTSSGVGTGGGVLEFAGALCLAA